MPGAHWGEAIWARYARGGTADVVGQRHLHRDRELHGRPRRRLEHGRARCVGEDQVVRLAPHEGCACAPRRPHRELPLGIRAVDSRLQNAWNSPSLGQAPRRPEQPAVAREGCTLTVLGGPAGTSSAVLVTDASLVSDIDASLVIEASSAVPEPRGVFIWMRRCRQSTFGTHAFRLNRDEHDLASTRQQLLVPRLRHR